MFQFDTVKRMKQAILWVVAAVVAFFAYGAYVGNTPEGKERARDRAVIDQCWKDQERKSNSPRIARLTAEMCEGLEDTFRKKYNREP